MMTRDEFIEREIQIWGDDYIFDLVDRGYLPVLTDLGWKWMVVSNRDYLGIVDSQLDVDDLVC